MYNIDTWRIMSFLIRGTRMKEKPRWWTIQAPLRALCFMTLARTAGKLPTRQGISNQSYILWSVSNAASHTGTSFSTWRVDVLFPSPFNKQLSNSRSPKAGYLTTFIYIHPHPLCLPHSLNPAWLPSFSCLTGFFFLLVLHENTIAWKHPGLWVKGVPSDGGLPDKNSDALRLISAR